MCQDRIICIDDARSKLDEPRSRGERGSSTALVKGLQRSPPFLRTRRRHSRESKLAGGTPGALQLAQTLLDFELAATPEALNQQKAGHPSRKPRIPTEKQITMDNVNLQGYLEAVGHWLITTGLQLVLIVVGLLIAQKAAGLIISRILDGVARRKEDVEYQKRTDTLKSVVRYLVSSVLFAIAVMMILGQLGIEIGPILAAAGVVGLAVGFGAQNLVKDVLGGFFILLEDQIRVGDVVDVSGHSGVVEQISLRMVTLRDLAGNVHYVRNGLIDVVTNMTKEYSRYVFDIGVAYREDVDEVMKVVQQLDKELREDPEFGDDILAPIEILGVDQFADSAVVIKARTTTRPIQQWRIGREFNRRMKRRFDELGIEIPFPHVTFYAGQDKKGKAPPMPLRLTGDGELD